MDNDISFYYDPQRQGYDTNLWKTVSGTPAESGGYLVFNNASAVGYDDIFKARAVYSANIPAAPTIGDARFIGLGKLAGTIRIGFDITDDVISAKCSKGSAVTLVNIVWKSAWTNAVVDYEVRWQGFEVKFYINGTKYATINANDLGLVYEPVSLYVNNSNSDNLKIANINVLDIKSII